MDSTGIQPQLGLTTYNNQSLFSDHYLRDILRTTAVWRSATEQGRDFLAWLRDPYAKEQAQLPLYKEAQLEDNWLRPIFNRLGHVWEGQATIPDLKGSISKPDYAFFPDEAARKAAVGLQNTADYAQAALALGEVKQWEVNLSKKTGSQPTFDAQNPMYQIDTYLTLTGVAWGILSNGRFWRLVHKNSSRTLETYFEIDLLAALHAPDETFATAVAAYFWLFFNQSSFRPDGKGRTFLDEALEQSRAYALALEADLRDNAYRSLEQLIIGFFAGDSGLDAQNPADRDEVYRNSLYLLYRLLFIFYGESRALLPMHHAVYREQYSLQQLAQKIDAKRNSLAAQPTTGKTYWNQLRELFRLISGHDEQLNADLGVPRYNGGLFDPAQHPFLEQHFVGDRALALAIDYLATRRIIEAGGKPAYQTVDYRTLDVRQLGSIYEGLLEYRVAVATEEMVTISQKGTETWVPAGQKGKAKTYGERRQAGELYLTTDKGERKATGSYYTPDYIVEYIVANTLGPLVEQVREGVKAQVRQTGSLDSAERERQSAVLFTEGILALNVLDPAMGSGHFLVEATNYLARALATDDYVQAGADETDLLYWKRRVVEACIYGVDKNPMAVELAKLSLWLKTAAADKPLSFLDHHLRHGDSLVGAWLADLRRAPGQKAVAQGSAGDGEQMALFNEEAFTQDAGLAVQGLAGIERLPTEDIEDVHRKETVWRDIQREHLARWRTLADMWTSAYFGNALTPEEYRALAATIQRQDSLMSEEQAARFLGHTAVSDNDYFHWQLAFPEVFFDEYGRSLAVAAGFDAVIGNPPYVRQEYLTPYKSYYKLQYASFSSTADLYLYFYEQGIRLLGEVGRIAYISSGTFAKTNSARPFREWLPNFAHIETLIDFGENQPFEGAEMVRPSIVVMRKGRQRSNFRSVFMDGTTIWKPLDAAMSKHGFECAVEILSQTEWTFQPIQKTNLAKKLFAQGVPLEQYVTNGLFNGIKTALNEAFYLDSVTYQRLLQASPTNDTLIKPMLVGADCRPWYQKSDENWSILIPMGWTRDQFGEGLSEEIAWERLRAKYPALCQHLLPFAEAARRRLDQGDYWWELRACSYYHVFTMPKIFWNDITKLPRFSWSEEEMYINQKGYVISNPHPSVLSILQSRVNWFNISQICTPLRLRAGLWQYQVLSQFVARLPIPDMSDSMREKLGEIAMTITALARQRYQLHQQIRHRIFTDLGTPEGKLNNALTAWWELEFSTFRAEIKKAFKHDIPLKERQEWELFLADARQQHQQLTAQIIALETELNQHVYALFRLTPEEIQIIETSTKYPYGEV